MFARRRYVAFLGISIALLFLVLLFTPVTALIGDINLDDIVNFADLNYITQQSWS